MGVGHVKWEEIGANVENIFVIVTALVKDGNVTFKCDTEVPSQTKGPIKVEIGTKDSSYDYYNGNVIIKI